jgi:hypothetical protein
MMVGATPKIVADPDSTPEANFVYVGMTEAGETTFLDILPRSYRTDYVYKVVPISRWGVVGPPSKRANISVKATMPPSVPATVSSSATLTPAGASPMGQIKIVLKPNLFKEGVTKYILLRKVVNEPVASTASASAGSTSVVQSGGKVLTVPTAPRLARDPKSYVVSPQSGTRPLVATSPNGNGGAVQGVLRSDVSTVTLGKATKIGMNAKATIGRMTIPITPEMVNWMDLSTYTQLQVSPKIDATTVTFIDSDLQAGAHYLYRVIAVNSDNLSSAASGVMDITPVKLYADPPVAGSGPRFDEAASTLTISWNAPASGAVSYIIERAIDGPSPKFIPLDTVPVQAGTGAPSYVDTNVRPGRAYIYRVISVDVEGNTSKRLDGANVVGVLDIRATAKT